MGDGLCHGILAWIVNLAIHLRFLREKDLWGDKWKDTLHFVPLKCQNSTGGWNGPHPYFMKRKRHSVDLTRPRNAPNPGPCPQGPCLAASTARRIFLPREPEIRPTRDSNPGRGGATSPSRPFRRRDLRPFLNIWRRLLKIWVFFRSYNYASIKYSSPSYAWRTVFHHLTHVRMFDRWCSSRPHHLPARRHPDISLLPIFIWPNQRPPMVWNKSIGEGIL